MEFSLLSYEECGCPSGTTCSLPPCPLERWDKGHIALLYTLVAAVIILTIIAVIASIDCLCKERQLRRKKSAAQNEDDANRNTTTDWNIEKIPKAARTHH